MACGNFARLVGNLVILGRLLFAWQSSDVLILSWPQIQAVGHNLFNQNLD